MSGNPVRTPARLRSMDPFGLGTAGLESQTSYLQRLAARLSVSNGKLFAVLQGEGQELFPDSWLGTVSHATNGARHAAARVSDALIDATQRPALRALTLLPWADVLPDWELIRPTLAWCPPCLARSPYERLSWSIKAVEVCAEHEVALVTTCHACGRGQPFMTATSRVGHCRWCKAELAAGPADPVADPWRRYGAEQIGALLATPPDKAPTRQTFAAGLRAAMTAASMNGALLASAMGLSKGTMSGWRKGHHVPSLEGSLRISAATGYPLRALLIGSADAECSAPVALPRSGWSGKKTRDADQLRAALEAALAADEPVSLGQLAAALKVEPQALRRGFPDLASRVVKRRKTEIAARSDERRSIAVSYVKAAVEATTAEGGKASRRSIETLLPAGLTLQEPALRDAWHALTDPGT